MLKKTSTFLLLLFFSISHHLSSVEYVTAHLRGRLGNQMFIIAAAEALAKENNAMAVFPDLTKKSGSDIPINRKKVFSRVDSSYPKEKIRYTFSEASRRYKKILEHLSTA